jgi:hypothetical protein
MTLKRRLRGLLLAHFPRTMTRLLTVRSRRLSHALIRRWGIVELNQRLVSAMGLRVCAGPFEGMSLPAEAMSEHLGPFLAGTYESELHPWLEELRSAPISQVVDIGCKFGYYAVGLGRWFPAAPGLAFDTDPWAQRATRDAAELNGLASLEIGGFVSGDELAQRVIPGALVLSDCEGYEDELFTPSLIEKLKRCTVIIETHDEAAPGVTDRIRRRFAASHVTRCMSRTDREVPAWLAGVVSREDAERAVLEFRGEQRWTCCVPTQRLPLN